MCFITEVLGMVGAYIIKYYFLLFWVVNIKYITKLFYCGFKLVLIQKYMSYV